MKSRLLLKTLSYRICCSSTSFLLTWLVSGTVAVAAVVAGLEMVAKTALYAGHEAAWESELLKRVWA